jgi:hypothetical protein
VLLGQHSAVHLIGTRTFDIWTAARILSQFASEMARPHPMITPLWQDGSDRPWLEPFSPFRSLPPIGSSIAGGLNLFRANLKRRERVEMKLTLQLLSSLCANRPSAALDDF